MAGDILAIGVMVRQVLIRVVRWTVLVPTDIGMVKPLLAGDRVRSGMMVPGAIGAEGLFRGTAIRIGVGWVIAAGVGCRFRGSLPLGIGCDLGMVGVAETGGLGLRTIPL